MDRDKLVLVAIPEAELAKRTASTLGERGLRASVVHDGVEAMLEVQRRLPRAVVLSAILPKMYGFQICELMKRNESLRSIPVVLAGSIYHKNRYRREPDDLYGADAYLEDQELPDGLIPILQRLGVATTAATNLPAQPTPMPSRSDPTVSVPPPTAPAAGAQPPPVPSAPTPSAAAPVESLPPAPAPRSAPSQVRSGDDGLAEERAKAERLARIIVSDIILYNEEKFSEAVRTGRVVEMMSPDLEEGRSLFCDRIDDRVREKQDHLVEELLRVARLRGLP